MLAVIAGLGGMVARGADSAFTLRLGFVVLFAGSTWLMARLTERRYGARAGLCAAIALNVSAYYLLAAGTFALPDGPLLFFWLLTLERLSVAFDSPERLGPWVGVGLAWGGALLSKYHGVFLPAGALVYILLDPHARGCLRRPGPYLAAAIGLLVFSPVILWNATHHWASFAFQGGRALGAWRLEPVSLAISVLGPAAYLLPWIWFRLVQILVREGRAALQGMGDRFLVCQAIVPLSAFAALACVRPLLPHWTLVGFLSLFPLLGRDWAENWLANPARFVRRLGLVAMVPVLVGVFGIMEARTGILQKGRPGGLALLPARLGDPTAEMSGWDQVADELRRRGLLDRPGTFLFTSFWYHSGQLAPPPPFPPFPCHAEIRPNPCALCYNGRGDARSFAFWSQPDHWVGHDGILIAVNDHPNEPQCFEPLVSRGWSRSRRSTSPAAAPRSAKFSGCSVA